MPSVDHIPTDDLSMWARVLLALQQLADAVHTRNERDDADREDVRRLTAALVRDCESRDAWRVWLTTSLEGRAIIVAGMTWAFGSGVIEALALLRPPL
jgi:hypothetical protein